MTEITVTASGKIPEVTLYKLGAPYVSKESKRKEEVIYFKPISNASLQQAFKGYMNVMTIKVYSTQYFHA